MTGVGQKTATIRPMLAATGHPGIRTGLGNKTAAPACPTEMSKVASLPNI